MWSHLQARLSSPAVSEAAVFSHIAHLRNLRSILGLYHRVYCGSFDKFIQGPRELVVYIDMS